MRTFFRWYYNLDPFAVKYIVPLAYCITVATMVTDNQFHFNWLEWIPVLLFGTICYIATTIAWFTALNWTYKQTKKLGVMLGMEKPEQ